MSITPNLRGRGGEKGGLWLLPGVAERYILEALFTFIKKIEKIKLMLILRDENAY